MTIERLADILEGIDERICAVVDHSPLSKSTYIELLVEQLDGSDQIHEIRMSGREMKLIYGKLKGHADFEIGLHQDADGSWRDCVKWVKGLLRGRGLTGGNHDKQA